MALKVIPLIHEFYLVAKKIEVPENRIIPTEIRDTGKILKATLFEKSREHLIIDAIYWEKIRIVQGVFIYHFHEILNGFVTNRLRFGQEHFIFNKEQQCGVKLYYGKGKEPDLCMEVYDETINRFVLANSFSKIECCIVVRLLSNYFHRGEIKEESLLGDVKCNYSGKSFTVRTPLL